MDLGASSRNWTINDMPTGILEVISGTGGYTKLGLSQLQFVGPPNTYTGETVVMEGALQMQKTSNTIPGNLRIMGGSVEHLGDDQISSSAQVIIDSGSWNIGSFNQTISSLIYNGGEILKPNPLQLTGGGIALQIGGATLTNEIELTSSDPTSIVFDPSSGMSGSINTIETGDSNTTINVPNSKSGAFLEIVDATGNGGFTKEGEGTLILSGIQNFSSGASSQNQGTILVNGTLQTNDFASNGGTLVIEGSLESTQFKMGADSILKGNGTLSGRGNLGGSIQPEDVPFLVETRVAPHLIQTALVCCI